MSLGPAIALQDVSVTVKGNTLLTPFSLSLSAGQWHGIAGPNGGGKSTLLKALAGLLNHQGRIERHWQPDDAKQIGYMPQLVPFDATLHVTALDFLRMNSKKRPVWQRYKTDSKLETAIDKVGVANLLPKRLGTLSTGERQRILLTAALLHTPSLLLLDEPIAGVDRKGREHIITLLSEFRQQGGTILMVEHDWQVIQQYCDSVSWIDGGLIEHGAPQMFSQMQAMPMGLRHAS
ncbi:ATP-binding cassette domain-containing protein [Maribrevibacterium harenarium]|uniref:ATP-binding cassette domain-containing protein n=1 Tax=Maribrevibacterium harenarium TaxID=2589817 RepID=A0A501X138_9GAMM|nr:ATP-binding cassette domain-containing protein [Maribrevibacterium harenarium]TPE54081.1 ATP-binding cassette domain-containing protein [Maribrevibacterium harenarium]